MPSIHRNKKLIETLIPLKKINEESVREKSLRHGLPSTLHLYWARRPLATTRSVLFAQLVDDPSARPDKFPTEAEQETERTRLQKLMERLAVWENINDQDLYQEARQAILDSNDGHIPAILDPFAGGGAIPLEAQRLGMESHASDLNPLAVVINKALIEIPSRFYNQPSIHPAEVASQDKTGGLADDIRYYGKMLRDIAYEKVEYLYPEVKDAAGEKHTVIAWIWARTVINPNPANPVRVPLVRSWWLCKKRGHEAWIKPIIENNKLIRYVVVHNAEGPTGTDEGTVNRRGAVSIIDGTPISLSYIRSEGRAGRLKAELIAVVAESSKKRLYLSVDNEQRIAAQCDTPSTYPDGDIFDWPGRINVYRYGMTHFSDLYSKRQLNVLTTLGEVVAHVHDAVLNDALASGMPRGALLDKNGNGAVAYADAISVYLALAISRLTDRCSTIASWQNIGEKVRNVFSRQAIPMTWDYAETNPFSSSTGNFLSQVDWVAEAIESVPAKPLGEAHQADAATRNYDNVIVSTDPPYYDNIGYSDLSDYFYVWLRPILKEILPSVFNTMLTPKPQELVANPYRHGGKEGAQEFFVSGFNEVFRRIREKSQTDIPMTIYYAYKQQDTKSGTSTGWYALLEGLIQGGWEITATWPVRSERGSRMLSIGTNALASSIVLACRPRPKDASSITLRSFNDVLRAELKTELETLMTSGIDPVDLNQAAIGPGISVYSRYSHIRQADGTNMSVQKALQIINRTIDDVMGVSESDYDSDTRFAVKWYQSYGWKHESSGTADQLSRSCGTSPDELVRSGIFEATGGKARLLKPEELTNTWDPLQDDHTSIWEAVIRMAGILNSQGVDAVVPIMAKVSKKMALDQIRELGFRMHHEADKHKDAEHAVMFNDLISVWDDMLIDASREISQPQANIQGKLDIK